MKLYASVCKNTILSNLKNGTNAPPIRLSKGKYGRPFRRHTFEFEGKIRIVYSPNKPAPWGARVWLELEN